MKLPPGYVALGAGRFSKSRAIAAVGERPIRAEVVADRPDRVHKPKEVWMK